jgi:hypothetical protein
MTAFWLGLLTFTHAADYLTFLRMVLTHGLSAEANPIVVIIARDLGIEALTLAKVAAVLVMVTTVVIVRRTRPRVAQATLAVGIVLGTVGTISNLASL